MRKALVLTLALIATLGCANAKSSKQAKNADPVVMTINGRDIPRSEFMYFYQKNNGAEQVEQKSFDEYVDLFINFRLKVEEALSRGIDTTQTYITELEGYRQQLAEPYLTDQQWLDKAIDQAIERSAYEVHAAHILFSCDANAAPDKVAAAKAKLAECRKQLEAGAPFDSLARVMSEDPSAKQNAGDLGYFSSLQMVFPFEEAAFTTPVGEVSEVRSRFGFHLIKVFDKRKGKGEVMPAHIMFNYRPAMTEADKNRIKAKADSVYHVLVDEKRPFEEVCAEVSEDVYTAQHGGKYNWVNSSARFPQEWLDAAFNQEKGAISKPFETQFGVHIMLTVDKRDAAPDTEEYRAELRKRLEKDTERKEAATRKQQDLWLAEEKAAFNAKVRAQVMAVLADTLLPADLLHERLEKIKKPLFTFAKEKHSAIEFGTWLTEKYGATTYHLTDADESLDAWSRELITKFEDAHLAERNQEYANLYKEYHDGILLFDVATEEVWDKAEKDTVGLEAYFEANRAKYAYDKPRFKGAFIECVDDAALVEALNKIYTSTSNYLEAAEMVKSTILTDTLLTPDPKHPRFHIVHGIYGPGDNATVDRDQLKIEGVNVTPRQTMPVQFTFGKVLSDGPEVLADVRNAVVADYQNELEKVWVAKLREKFAFKLNQPELDKIKAETEK